MLFGPEWIWGIVWFFAKLFLFLFMFVWFRATLPRVRYDQLMDVGWKVLIPLALGWFLLLGAIRVGNEEGWNAFAVVAIAGMVLGLGGLLLWGAVHKAKRDRLDADEEVYA